MNRFLSCLAAAGLLAGVLSGVATPASSAAPADAPSAHPAASRAPGFTYLSGRTIHLAQGGQIRVPVRTRPTRFASPPLLLGQTSRGWIVDVGAAYYAVTRSGATRIASAGRRRIRRRPGPELRRPAHPGVDVRPGR